MPNAAQPSIRVLSTRLFPPQRRAVFLQEILRELASAPEGTVQLWNLIDRLMQRHAHNDEERLIIEEDNWGPFPEAVYLASSRAQRAGWLTRRGGRWTITDSGRAALLHYADPAVLYEKVDTADLDGDGIPDNKDDRLPYVGEIDDWGTLPATIFKQGSAPVEYLVSAVESGALGLPDIQRPFVWDNVKVRDLLDSIFRGFPIGYLLLWDNPVLAGKSGGDGRVIGTGTKGTNIAKTLIIDGQQRLTSLYAVLTGRPVLDHAFRERHIQIAFHPIEGRFEVADAANLKDPQWIPDVSEIFRNPAGLFQLVPKYLARLKSARDVGPEHEQAAMNNLQRLAGMKKYTLGTLEIGADADEEQVAEIFVRVNSKGQNLKQADFILTLLSVFWEEGREQLEAFARASREPVADAVKPTPFNRLLHPEPDDLLRVVIAISHRRARLRDSYQVLRGRDPQTGKVTAEARDQNLALLREAQARVLDPTCWHDFLTCLGMAGYRAPGMLPSVNTALYAYAFFLLGREEYRVPKADLRRLIARIYLMATVTDRYTSGSPETAMESDLARLRSLQLGDSAGFVRTFEDLMSAELTRDFWEVTLPSRFETSSQRAMSPFLASLCVLEARALFSQTGMSVEKLLDPEAKGKRNDLEIHHLFPKAWLKENGFDEARIYNQIANLTPIEYEVNMEIGARPPTKYAPELALANRHGTGETARLHALPEQWWAMTYPDFLGARRKLMAGIVREGFQSLAGKSE